jgi:hypothetical protein
LTLIGNAFPALSATKHHHQGITDRRAGEWAARVAVMLAPHSQMAGNKLHSYARASSSME